MGSITEMTSKRWEIAPIMPSDVGQRISHYHPILQQVLYNRGLTTEAEIEAFITGQYLLSTDPFELKGMGAAVQRIGEALANQENIVVYGDFDCDGVTSTVLLTEALRRLGFDRSQVRPYIPDRIDEGYGLNHDALLKIQQDFGAKLVITVDCGIRSVAEVAQAQSNGLDVILTDHHNLGSELPPALAIINPKQPDCTYPEEMLAGVGLAYKLAQALHIHHATDFDTTSLLDLVAIGTVADVTPLLGENRLLVRDGLTVLNQLNRPGLVALAEVAGLKKGQITAESIAFALGPRINAAGRIGPQTVEVNGPRGRMNRPGHAYIAAYLLTATNLEEARFWAHKVNDLNRTRQHMTTQLNLQAETLIGELTDQHLLIAAHEDFLPGVIGLVAGRLKENYYRPAIVLEIGEEESHGSCRSIPEFHMTNALDQVADLLVRYGGHAQAAGLTIRNDNISTFTERMGKIAGEMLEGADLRPTISVDCEIDLSMVDWALHGVLTQLEPTGCANVAPVFISRSIELIHHRAVGRDHSHLQVELVVDPWRTIKGIGFGLGSWAGRLKSHLDIVYTVSVNEWKGNRRLQLQVLDLLPVTDR
ncbi:MAG: single-stranded-DNA-specific exonuclease RecJ [Ardenticatenaceae bacterium]|nr:single-stranded-DNA-specific exonuclease RecJ [Ardenticatenaceae bacterium]